MTKLFLPIFALIFASCATQVAPTGPSPIARPDATPVVEAVEAPLQQAQDTTDDIRTDLEAAKTEIEAAKREADAFENEVFALREKGLSAEAELELTWQELNKTKARNLFLETKIVEAVTKVDTLKNQLEATKQALDKAKQATAAKDIEAQELRTQLDHAKNANATLLQENQKLTKQAASALVYKRWVIGLVSAWLIWTAIKQYLMRVNPTTAYRL